jgi:hypothetical protein
MGEPRFVVKNPGPAAGESGYCVTCAEIMLAEAQRTLAQLSATLRR